ncbi:unnamed protein product, partial [Ascophyllum nodosum]
VLRNQYWLTRVVFLRCLGFVYMVAFLVALNDNGALLGEDGLLPAARFMDHVESHLTSLTAFEKVLKVPTIFWFVPPTASNLWWTAAVGAAVSGIVSARGAANLPAMALLWALYHSLVNVGQTWYSFGWESQLLETGFLAMFLVPWISLSRFPAGAPSSLVSVWGCRWLLFRIMLGAGLIKLRGDACWRDLTCMDYHYETQPNPNPLSRYLHHLPSDWHKFEVAVNHVVELVLPFGLLLGRRQRSFAGAAQVLFQVALVTSGNLSFLNWLTSVPAVFAFDDLHLSWLFSARARSRAIHLAAREASARPGKWRGARAPEENTARRAASVSGEGLVDVGGGGPPRGAGEAKAQTEGETRAAAAAAKAERGGFWAGKTLRKLPRWSADALLAALIVRGSIPVVKNMAGLGRGQVMNTSFDSLRLVNTYGAFGSVTKTRGEVVLKGTRHRDPRDGDAVWEEYGFKCKPGDVNQRPCVITPFHYRLDWQMWFAAFQNYGHNPWLVNLAFKLLSRDHNTRTLASSLLRHDPFHPAAAANNRDGDDDGDSGSYPLFIKADLYVYDVEAEQADAGRDGRICLTRPNSQARTGTGEKMFIPFQLTSSSIGTHTELIHTLAGSHWFSGGDGEENPPPLRPGEEKGVWWTRRFVREYMPPISLENQSARNFLRHHGLLT